LRPKSEEPQSPQNHFSPPSTGFHTRSRSTPATIRNVPAAALAALAVAVAGKEERRRDFESHRPAVAGPCEGKVSHLARRPGSSS
jgi:hypothetical protein